MLGLVHLVVHRLPAVGLNTCVGGSKESKDENGLSNCICSTLFSMIMETHMQYIPQNCYCSIFAFN